MADRSSFQRILRNLSLAITGVTVLVLGLSAVEALSFLHREGKYKVAVRPDLILLDLNMPKKGGREVLAELKEDPKLRLIPVVVLTTSAAEKDILNSYDLHANCYMTKPVDIEQFMKVVKLIEDFWLTIVKLPKA